MLTVYGTFNSTCTSRVYVSLVQLGLQEGTDFRISQLEDYNIIRSPEWIEKQPFSQMPYAVDEVSGLVIFESRAIAKYAAAKFAPKSNLVPSASGDLAAYAKFEIGASIETANWDPIVKDLFIATLYVTIQGGQIDPKKVEELETKLKGKLEGYERLLSKQAFVGGDHLTLVDLFHIPFVEAILPFGAGKPIVDGTFPKVTAWYKGLVETEGWKAVIRARSA